MTSKCILCSLAGKLCSNHVFSGAVLFQNVLGSVFFVLFQGGTLLLPSSPYVRDTFQDKCQHIF